MKLIIVHVCRDRFSYDPMTHEVTEFLSDEEAPYKYSRFVADYLNWLKRGGGSKIWIGLYTFNEQDGGITLEQRTVETIPVKKRVVVNPELAIFREKNPRQKNKKSTNMFVQMAAANQAMMAEVPANGVFPVLQDEGHF